MLTEVYQVLFALTAVAISLCAVVSLYHRPISKLIDIRRLKKKKVGKNHLNLVKANRLKKPNPSSILFFRKMQNYHSRYKMRINTISIECFQIMRSKNATLQRLLNLKPNPKWFFDDDLNIYISNIRNGKRKLAKALKTAGPRQIENCRNEGRRIADNGKILHKTINRDFLQGIKDEAAQESCRYQLETLNIFNRQLFILCAGQGYKYLPTNEKNNCEQILQISSSLQNSAELLLKTLRHVQEQNPSVKNTQC